MKKRSKRYKKLLKDNKDKNSGIFLDIVDLVKKTSTAKFDESIDVFFRINLKQTYETGCWSSNCDLQSHKSA